MTAPIRKAVFPIAGLGTRFLPATKASAKEMLPVVDKPLIQYAVEEAYAAGIRQMIFVGESTDAIRREAVRGGMRTLRQDALTKVLEGISTVEEVLRVTPNESQE